MATSAETTCAYSLLLVNRQVSKESQLATVPKRTATSHLSNENLDRLCQVYPYDMARQYHIYYNPPATRTTPQLIMSDPPETPGIREGHCSRFHA